MFTRLNILTGAGEWVALRCAMEKGFPNESVRKGTIHC